MSKVTWVMTVIMASLLVYAQSVGPARALSAGSKFDQTCKECKDKCDKDYPRGGGPLITCKSLCPCKQKLQVQ